MHQQNPTYHDREKKKRQNGKSNLKRKPPAYSEPFFSESAFLLWMLLLYIFTLRHIWRRRVETNFWPPKLNRRPVRQKVNIAASIKPHFSANVTARAASVPSERLSDAALLPGLGSPCFCWTSSGTVGRENEQREAAAKLNNQYCFTCTGHSLLEIIHQGSSGSAAWNIHVESTHTH